MNENFVQVNFQNYKNNLVNNFDCYLKLKENNKPDNNVIIQNLVTFNKNYNAGTCDFMEIGPKIVDENLNKQFQEKID